MNTTKPFINLFYHLFYESGLDILYDVLNKLEDYNLNVFVNISNDNIKKEELFLDIKRKYPDAIIIFSTNKGKDIGAKLALIDLYLKLELNAHYSIFLHDKKSPHTTVGEIWREKLFRITEKEHAASIFKLFEKDAMLGIVSSKEFIINEYIKEKNSFNCSSADILKELISEYQLNLKTYDFVGGTMFWIRTEIINVFFKKNASLQIREQLETGNILDNEKGTRTHAWERMLSWIAIDQGYYIYGI